MTKRIIGNEMSSYLLFYIFIIAATVQFKIVNSLHKKTIESDIYWLFPRKIRNILPTHRSLHIAPFSCDLLILAAAVNLYVIKFKQADRLSSFPCHSFNAAKGKKIELNELKKLVVAE